MLIVSRIIYNIGTGLYFFGIRITALFNDKARKWVEGRSLVFSELNEVFAGQLKNPKQIIWMHCASLGEFEQGRNIIEKIKKEKPTYKILLTFFSPSGFEIKKNYKNADWVFYLPADNKKNAQRFVEIINPSLAIFVKYEFWFHYLTTLKKNSIPVFLIAATFRKNQPFFKWYGILHRKMLACFKMIFVQDENSKKLLQSINFNNAEIAGDSRIDRVLSIAQENAEFTSIKLFCQDCPVLIAGSTWSKDEELLAVLSQSEEFKNWKLIIAPHDVSPSRIEELKSIFSGRGVPLSQLTEIEHDRQILIIDSIGKLAKVYRYGRIAYIGGGFGSGIHNTLEPMAFNLPVIYGPRYQKFVEAKTMVQKGGHFVIHNKNELLDTLKNLKNEKVYTEATHQIERYINTNKGASETIENFLGDYL